MNGDAAGADASSGNHLHLLRWATDQVASIRAGGDQIVDCAASSSMPADKLAQLTTLTRHLSTTLGALQSRAQELQPVLAAADAAAAQLTDDERKALWLRWQQRQAASAQELQRRARDAADELAALPGVEAPAAADRMGSVGAAGLQSAVQWAAGATGVCMELAAAGRSGPVPADSATQVYVRICPSLTAVVALETAGAPTPVRVAVSGADEAGSMHAWGCSRHLVCRRVSAVAMAALQYFYGQAHGLVGAGGLQAPQTVGRIVLENLLLWLTQYKDLYTKPSDGSSGRLLAADPAKKQLLPPVVRAYRRSRAELLAAADGRVPLPAYHVHDAPLHEL